jgi:hypothetical protein
VFWSEQPHLKTRDIWRIFLYFHIAWNGFRAKGSCLIQFGSFFCRTENDQYLKTWRLMSGDFLNAPIHCNAIVIITRVASPVFIYVYRYFYVLGWHIRVLDWMIGFIASSTFTEFGNTGNYSIAILHTFHFTVAHALGFSVFTSRILVTDLSQSHCNFNSHMKSSWHILIPFLPFFLITLDSHLQNSTKFSF